MSLINWIFDIYQHSKINDAQSEAAAMRGELAQLRRSGGSVDVARLEDVMGELALATKTIQRMLLEKGVCSQSEFTALLNNVYSEDGQRDGKTPLR